MFLQKIETEKGVNCTANLRRIGISAYNNDFLDMIPVATWLAS